MGTQKSQYLSYIAAIYFPCYRLSMADRVLPIKLSGEDQKLVSEIQKALEKVQGFASQAAAIRYALRQTVAQLPTRKGKWR
jgi:hypothetical protein